MDAFIEHTGKVVPYDMSNVDTDQIIPSDWLKRVERTGFEKGLFSEWKDDPEFILNDEVYSAASILIAGPNFGTGSSREHAVWAIQQAGFKAVISPRFGPIFKNNSTKNGLVPVEVETKVGNRLLEEVRRQPLLEFVIDVERALVEIPEINFEFGFPLDQSVQERLLNGLDDISITLTNETSISRFEESRLAWLPSQK